MDRGHRVVSGGTDNHLMLLDVRTCDLNGKQAEEALGEAGITVNKNMIPFDPEKPWIASGVRIGLAAVTTLVDDRQLIREMSETLPPISLPKKFVVIPEMPKMGSGKIDFRTVTAMVRERV